MVHTPLNRMPTFLVLKNSKVIETIRGANAAALRSAIVMAAENAKKAGPGGGAAFASQGSVLGASDGARRPAGNNSPQDWVLWLVGLRIVRPFSALLGLYLETLFSLDPRAAAEQSRWRVGR